METELQKDEENLPTGLSERGILKSFNAEVFAKTHPQFRTGTPPKLRRSKKTPEELAKIQEIMNEVL